MTVEFWGHLVASAKTKAAWQPRQTR